MEDFLPGNNPYPSPKVEGPDLTNGEIVVFLIITAILIVTAITFTIYFYRKINKQKLWSKEMMINNQKSESEVIINGKQNIHS